MSSIDEKISAAKAAQEKNRPHKDVTVSLDRTLSTERGDLADEAERLGVERATLIEAASETLALAPDTAAVDKQLVAVEKKLAQLDKLEQDTLVTVRIYRAPGDGWFELKASHPARVASAIDRAVGYNTSTLTKDAIERFAVVVDGETETSLTDDQWSEVWTLLAGEAFERLADAVYNLNVEDSRQRVERLKNSFEAATASAKK